MSAVEVISYVQTNFGGYKTILSTEGFKSWEELDSAAAKAYVENTKLDEPVKITGEFIEDWERIHKRKKDEEDAEFIAECLKYRDEVEAFMDIIRGRE